jgi:hypothetical protein
MDGTTSNCRRKKKSLQNKLDLTSLRPIILVSLIALTCHLVEEKKDRRSNPVFSISTRYLKCNISQTFFSK